MKIAVIGMGYVGLSNAVLLARQHEVIAVDISAEKVDLINRRISPLEDVEIQKYLTGGELNIRATLDKRAACQAADYILVATPTDYDTATNFFNTESVDRAISDSLLINRAATIVIKSTVPVGYTALIKERMSTERILFSPEFLREGQALHDNLYPSRIVVGGEKFRAEEFAKLMRDCAEKKNVPVAVVASTEAEAIKLFSNTYLAMRVAFFNELDTYAIKHGLDARSVVEGVCLDPRIGGGYNNPSFGYGGYCLPKDTKQLLANFDGVPQKLIKAIVESNDTRKNFITEEILKKRPKRVGVYRLVMKTGSDNFRSSSIQDVMASIDANDVELIVFEPRIQSEKFGKWKVEVDLQRFKEDADLILANRMTTDLSDVLAKVYTRDLFGTG